MAESRFTRKPSPALGLDEQIAYLRKLGEVWPLKAVAALSAAIAAACMYAFSQSKNVQLGVFLLFVSSISGILSVAIATQLPQWQRAARATHTGRRVQGFITLTVDRSDSENTVISGEIKDGNATWQLKFSKPLGWEPEDGNWPCEMVLLSDEPVPAIVKLEQGLLLPTRQSRRRFGNRA